MLAVKFSTLERTIKRNKPCRGEFGWKKEYRCNRCEEPFTERELIQENRDNKGDMDFCPNCGWMDDWNENEEIKARVTRRWSIKFHKHMESAA